MYALTSFADPVLVRRTMDLALSDVVRSQDAKIVVAALLANSDTRRLAWQLTRERWPELHQKTGEFVGNTVIVGALGNFCDAATAAEVKTFFTTNTVPDAERTLQQSTERIQTCAATAAVQGPKLAEWLKAPGR
jgi:aminopeptidase N